MQNRDAVGWLVFSKFRIQFFFAFFSVRSEYSGSRPISISKKYFGSRSYSLQLLYSSFSIKCCEIAQIVFKEAWKRARAREKSCSGGSSAADRRLRGSVIYSNTSAPREIRKYCVFIFSAPTPTFSTLFFLILGYLMLAKLILSLVFIKNEHVRFR